MKVIDLLNKIANGEAPSKIRYNGRLYYLYDSETYLRIDKERVFDMVYFSSLNDEVEVIEEDKNIEKLNCSSRYTRNQRKIINKINEIIDKVNKGE